jgi:Flp pilus assembly protein TadG
VQFPEVAVPTSPEFLRLTSQYSCEPLQTHVVTFACTWTYAVVVETTLGIEMTTMLVFVQVVVMVRGVSTSYAKLSVNTNPAPIARPMTTRARPAVLLETFLLIQSASLRGSYKQTRQASGP